jgi:hypothetical protein
MLDRARPKNKPLLKLTVQNMHPKKLFCFEVVAQTAEPNKTPK